MRQVPRLMDSERTVDDDFTGAQDQALTAYAFNRENCHFRPLF